MYAAERAPSLFEKILHYGLMGFVLLVAILGACVAYKNFSDAYKKNAATEANVKDSGFETGVFEEKPLPEFMIENIKPNELEKLKP